MYNRHSLKKTPGITIDDIDNGNPQVEIIHRMRIFNIPPQKAIRVIPIKFWKNSDLIQDLNVAQSYSP